MKKAVYTLIAFAMLLITTASSCPGKEGECKECQYINSDGITVPRQVCGEMEEIEFLDAYSNFSPSCP